MHVRTGGSGEPVLLLLHGLGATSDVWTGWEPVLRERWSGRWVMPDLPGHGASEPLERYSFGAFAAAVAGVVGGAERVTVVGHSMGGVVGLALASGWFGVDVDAVVGLGIKVEWTPDELQRARDLAARPVAWFDTCDDAVARHLRVSGLVGLIDPASPSAAAGVRAQDGRWRLALDQAAFGVGAPDMRGLLAAARARVLLARGENDPMVSDAQLAALGVPTRTLPGLGHNAHVEDPAAVFDLIARHAAAG